MIKQLLQPEIQKFINDHLNDQPAELMLKASQFPDWPMLLIVEQISAKKKAKTKLPAWFACDNLIYPPVLSMEQCSSQKAADYKASLVTGLSMVDLTGGFGVDTFYLAQKFVEAIHIEMNEKLSSIVRHNFSELEASIETVCSSAENYLQTMAQVDLIYIDPARRDEQSRKVVFLEDYSPNVIDLMPQLMVKGKMILIKASPMLDIKKAIADLKYVEEVHVLSIQNEVKELLFLLSNQGNVDPMVKAINLHSDQYGIEFRFSEEEAIALEYSQVGDYLYEPNASIMKAGAFKSVASQFNLKKLHANTHLYTSDLLIADFPGRVFKVISELNLNKKKLKKELTSDKANITVRNFPLSVQEIRNKTGLKEGGNAYIFATSDISGRKVFLCEKV